jgi:hypothetical protein
MGEFGNAVFLKGFGDLPRQVQGNNQKEGKGNFPLPDVRKGREQNHHKHNPAGSQKSQGRKKHVQKSCGQRGYGHHKQEAQGTVLFLKNRPQKKDEGEIADEVGKIDMPRGMGKESDIMKGIGKIENSPPGYGKKVRRKIRSREGIQKQDGKTQKGKRQCNRSVITNFHWYLL